MATLFFSIGNAQAWPRFTSASYTDRGAASNYDLTVFADRKPDIIYVFGGGGHHKSQAADDPYTNDPFKKRKLMKKALEGSHAGPDSTTKGDQVNQQKVRAKVKATAGKVSTPGRSGKNPSEKRAYPAPSSQEKKSRPKIVEPKTVTEPLGGAE